MVRPIGHLHYFSKKSATFLLNSIGAKVVSMEIVKLPPERKWRIRNFIWLLATFPLQFMRRNVRNNPYRARIALLFHSWVSLWSNGDQLYVEGVIGLES